MLHARDKILNASDHVAFHMDKILEAFKRGSKITVLVRQTDDPNGLQDFTLTNDDLTEAIKGLQRRHERGDESPK